jgi:hypothetical protein
MKNLVHLSIIISSNKMQKVESPVWELEMHYAFMLVWICTSARYRGVIVVFISGPIGYYAQNNLYLEKSLFLFGSF